MVDGIGRDRVRETGRLLQSLLLERAEYRNRWRRYEKREPTRGKINQAAVAQVIAHHLWESGDRSESDSALPRELKDRVRRALAGDLITAETLGWFIEAFGMSPDDAERLRCLRFAGRARGEDPIVGTLHAAQFVPLPQRHRTLAVFERRVIDQNMRAVAHRSTRALTACEDGVDSYPCRLIPSARDVRLLQGGHTYVVRAFEESTPILEIKLNRALRAGETAYLEYEVEFDRESRIQAEYRRVAHAPTENLSIVVQFHPQCPPRRIWRTVWDDYHQGNILRQVPVTLDRDCCVDWFIPYLENAAAGFSWTW
jgi:hypothetical protein